MDVNLAAIRETERRTGLWVVGAPCLQEQFMIILFGLKKMNWEEVLLAESFEERAAMIAKSLWPSSKWHVLQLKMWINCGQKSTFWLIWITQTFYGFWKLMRTDAASTL